MKQSKLVVMKLVVCLFLAVTLVFGCSSTSKEVNETDGYSEARWYKYVTNQQKGEIEPIDVQDVDKVRFSINDIYNTTYDMTVSYAEKVKNHKPYHDWLKLTKDWSDERRNTVWKNEIESDHKKAVLAFNEANQDTYSKAVSMLPEALELYESIDKLDFKQVSKKAGANVFKAKSMVSGLNDSKDQITYTVEVLKLMDEEYKRYQRFKAER